MTLTPSQFAVLCFNVLMANNDGFMGKAPSYVDEKVAMLKEGYTAYGRLDRLNQLKVLKYHLIWNLDKPEKIKKYEEEYAQATNTIKTDN